MVCVLLVYVVPFKHFNGTCGWFEEHVTICISHFDPKFKFVSAFLHHTNSRLDDSFFSKFSKKNLFIGSDFYMLIETFNKI
jgi:hypothetical protein